MLKDIINIAGVTFKGGLRSRLFLTIVVLALLVFLILIPSMSSFSMRQIREVATSLSLSVISFILLVLTIFLSITLIYRDMESRVAISVLSLPISRPAYIIGKYLGLVVTLVFTTLILFCISVPGLIISDALYKTDMPIKWSNYMAATFTELLKMLIIGAWGVLLSSFATNAFLPLFGTVGIYIIGTLTQSIYDYIRSPYGEELPAIAVIGSKIAYYLFPNLTALDLKFKAIYNLPLSYGYLGTVSLYSLTYITVVLSLAVLAFNRRQIL